MRFFNRVEAGKTLGRALKLFASDSPIVVGLPRGGMVVAAEVAKALNAPLDVCVVRKVGVPGERELGMGAVSEGGFKYLNREVIGFANASPQEVDACVREEQREVEQRIRRYRRGQPPVPIEGSTVIVVDDGIATGGTMRAAILALKARQPSKLVLAVPVAAQETLEMLHPLVDEVVCLFVPDILYAIGAWYEDFDQIDDDEVAALLDDARSRQLAPVGVEEDVTLAFEGVVLRGTLAIPPGAPGIVLFAHGSGSSRNSPRNRHVAEALRDRGLGTLLFDLLTESEEDRDELTGELRFDIGLLARRLAGATAWVHAQPRTRGLWVGYFGASTGAAAALVAAAAWPSGVDAIVSRGGRPDLAGEALAQVRTPSLFIVGGDDVDVLELNREAALQMQSPPELVVVPGATHLFEEPGALDQVALLAAEFFARYLSARPEQAVSQPGL
jgi:putative phosphoribosyl transferase